VWVGGLFGSLSLEREGRCRRWPLHPGFFTVSEEGRKHHPPPYKQSLNESARSATLSIPNPAITRNEPLLDQVVRAQQQRLRNCEPERLCCFHVDGELELGRAAQDAHANLFARERAPGTSLVREIPPEPPAQPAKWGRRCTADLRISRTPEPRHRESRSSCLPAASPIEARATP
jgi:hypothetical protein